MRDSIKLRRLFWCFARSAVAVMFTAQVTVAQPTPVGLVHGIRSTGSTWDDLRSALSGNTSFSFPAPPSLSANSGIANQSSQLLGWKNSGGFNSRFILVGHSQGGLVSRFASRTDTMAGLITIGTPHLGAPIASASGTVSAYLLETAFAGGAVQYFQYIQPWEPYFDEAQQALAHAPDVVWNIALLLDIGVQLMFSGNASLTDLTPGSAILAGGAGLNTTPGTEKTGARLAIVSSLLYGYSGGPARLATNDAGSDYIGENLLMWAFQLEEDAANLAGITGTWNVVAWFGLIDLAFLVYDFAPFWHWEVVGGVPNDVIVPSWSQEGMPSQTGPFVVINATSHVEETSRSAVILDRLLAVP